MLNPERTSKISYLFGDFVLDLDRGLLTNSNGLQLSLRPKSFALLKFFVENCGRLLDRQAIMEAVWPGVFVSDESIAQCVREVRRTLGDLEQRFIKTVIKRGYVFDLKVSVQESLTKSSYNEFSMAKNEEFLLVKNKQDAPSIAVIPFVNLSDNSSENYFSLGVTEEIINALARIRWFSVVSWHMPMFDKEDYKNAQKIGHELGVRYVLEGGVRRAGSRLRITGRLVDVATGHHIWADRIEGVAEEIFELQDAVTQAIVSAIEPTVEFKEIEHVRKKPLRSADTYDLLFRALELRMSMTECCSEQAIKLLHQALLIDPNFAPAKAHLLLCYIQRAAQGWDCPGENEDGTKIAREAIALHGSDPLILETAAHALNTLAFDAEGALEAATRALSLHPNSAWIHNAFGWANLWAGNPEIAGSHLAQAIRMNPYDPDIGYCYAGLGLSHLLAGHPGEALSWGRRALRCSPTMAAANHLVIGALIGLNRKDEAVIAAQLFRQVAPKAACVRANRVRKIYCDRKQAEMIILGRRVAGLPE